MEGAGLILAPFILCGPMASVRCCAGARGMKEIRLERGLGATPEIRALIGELDAELGASCTPEQRHGLKLEALFAPHIRFYVAWTEDGPQGCGGVALFCDFAELKRLYVRPAARGKGIAEAILQRLTADATQAGLTLLRLETATLQTRALRFYRRCGFQPCGAFKSYASMPPLAIAASIFMEKTIA
jgi:putative acetyltransferase